MAKFEGIWVKIEGVIANPKNRQMWDFRFWEVELGIGSSLMKYVEWNGRGVSEVSGNEIYLFIYYYFFFRKGSATARK